MRLKGLATSDILSTDVTQTEVRSALTNFEDVKKMDLVNEKMPTRKPGSGRSSTTGFLERSASKQNAS